MKRKKFRVSLKVKVLSLIVFLLLFLISILFGVYSYYDIKNIKQQANQLSLQTAKTLSFSPEVKNAILSSSYSEDLTGLVEQIVNQVDAEFVKVNDRKGKELDNGKALNQSKKQFKKENNKAITFGGYYNLETKTPDGKVLWGKAPVMHEGRVIGVVSVGYLTEDIKSEIIKKITKTIWVSLIVLVLGVVGGILLVLNIRKDTLGLEPHEIAALYRERNAILSSIREGIISTDKEGTITTINRSGKEMLGIVNNVIGISIEDIVPQSGILNVLKTGKPEKDTEIQLNSVSYIVNRVPIEKNGDIVGVVSTFRNKTELKKLTHTLTEIRKYSEDMRAQTHEFRNKLYVLSGLLQLEQYQEAIEMIQAETANLDTQNRILFDRIMDPKVQAVILGKISKSSEKRVRFIIDDNSSLQHVPSHIDTSHLIIILGNLLDNAMEAVANDKNGAVSFFTTDMSNDIVFEIADNGPGVPSKLLRKLFKKGFTTKQNSDSGYGLWNVYKAVNELGGSIEITNQKEGGAVFTIFLPKQSNQNN